MSFIFFLPPTGKGHNEESKNQLFKDLVRAIEEKSKLDKKGQETSILMAKAANLKQETKFQRLSRRLHEIANEYTEIAVAEMMILDEIESVSSINFNAN